MCDCVHHSILPSTSVSCIYCRMCLCIFGGGTFRVRCSSGQLDRDARIHPTYCTNEMASPEYFGDGNCRSSAGQAPSLSFHRHLREKPDKNH